MFKYCAVLFVLSFYVFANSRVLNNNGDSALLKKEPEVAVLEKIYTIDSSSELFTLKDPYKFKLNNDGSLFVIDWRRALYRFSSTGKYLGNLLKKGEGPGELKFFLTYYLQDNSVIQFCHYPNKIVIKDLKGKLKNEFSIPEQGVLSLLGVTGERYYFTKAGSRIDYKKFSGKYRDSVDQNFFYSWKYGDKKIKKSKIYYNKTIRIKTTPGGGMISRTSPLHAVTISNLENNFLYFVNSFDYKIKKIRMSDLTLEKEFGRPFTKVEYFHPPSYFKRMKKAKRSVKEPEKKHFKSVMKLFNLGEELWVITSVYKKGKGLLVDIFSNDGVYKDKFYLPVPGVNSPHKNRFNIVDGKLIVLEKDEDDEHVISIYKIKK